MAKTESHPKEKHSKNDLIQWATACMAEGLPEKFHEAWIKYSKEENQINIEYRVLYMKGNIEEKFEPADHLYPVQCIELLNDYLEEEKRNWTKCFIYFTPKASRLKYEY